MNRATKLIQNNQKYIIVPNSPIIHFQKVSKSYGSRVVVNEVVFKINRGSITTLIGPNGAGKTTIARLMLGIEKPSFGRILSLSKHSAYIPQKISLNSGLPMNVRSLLKYMRGGKAADMPKVREFAQLESLHDKQISELSGGQLQRVLLAGGMMSNPDLIVLDEPTQGLDINGQQEFYELLEEIRRSFGVAIFMISHDLYAVMKNSDQVLCLNHHHICCEGKPSGEAKSQIGLYTHHHDHNHH